MKDDFAYLRRLVVRAFDETRTSRDLAIRDRNYYDGRQWTIEEENILKRRQQPIITDNRVRRKVDFLRGVEQRGRTDPKAWPRNPQDEKSAEVATDGMRFVADQQRIDFKRSQAFDEMLVEGIGVLAITAEPNAQGQDDVKVRRIRWDTFFYDPHSRELDFSDAKYLGEARWAYEDDLIAQFPDSEKLIRSAQDSREINTEEDKPEHGSVTWTDPKSRRLLFVELWYRAGKEWHWCQLIGLTKLDGGPSPYKDEFGQSVHQYVAQCVYRDRDNMPYGVVRDMIPLQDEINKRRSKLLHMLNVRQTKGHQGAVPDIGRMKKEMSSPNGHVEYIPGHEFDIIDQSDQVAGQAALLQEAKDSIDRYGPNAALQGRGTEDQSGRAIIAQQQSGLAEVAPIFDALRDFTLRAYRAIWNRIKQFWTDERWIRVTDEEGASRFVGVNRPMMAQRMTPGGVISVPTIENNVAEMDVDIVIDEAPDYTTMQAEQFEQMVRLVEVGIQLPPDILIMSSQLRNKREILDRLSQPNPMQEQAGMLDLKQKAADVDKTVAETEAKRADVAKKGFDVGRGLVGPPQSQTIQ